MHDPRVGDQLPPSRSTSMQLPGRGLSAVERRYPSHRARIDEDDQVVQIRLSQTMLLGIGVGGAITIIFGVTAIVEWAMRSNTLIFAHLFFPVPMLLFPWFPPALLLTVLQYPLYGLIVGLAVEYGKKVLIGGILTVACLHLLLPGAIYLMMHFL